uniref:Uncharacterized protein n=2 Tax=Aegilops tauschii subsp. strangulata TaxID=200361 RepID=A0A453GSW7_AEGTS
QKMKLKGRNQFTSTMKSMTQSKGKLTSFEIKDIGNTVEKLHKICDNVHAALLIEKHDKLLAAIQNTSTNIGAAVEFFTESKLFPRKEEADVLKLISASKFSDQELLVLPIVGHGGVGKTTLARLVYHNPQVGADFAIKIWVHVSANFDEIKLAQGILEEIAPASEYANIKHLNGLQRVINKYLHKKTYLLVLDDMWEESEARWDKLLAPLRCTDSKGNVILMTTRKLSVANITSKVEGHIKLGGMNDETFWPFFKRCIFRDENYQGNNKLQGIGKEIAIKLKGNPLAAKSVATLLRRNLTEVYWKRILKSDEWKLSNTVDDIIPALKLSYNHLPYHLQQLFSYCAMFPKGYRFEKEQLIRMWIALGFVMDERKKLEDAGSDNFDDLVDRSFFQKDEQHFIVHDLMHDVAQEVSVHECLLVDGSDSLKVFTSIRHVGIWTESVWGERNTGIMDSEAVSSCRCCGFWSSCCCRVYYCASLPFFSIMQWLSHANALRLRIVLPLGPDVLHNNYSNKWIGVCSLSLDPPAAAFCRTISRPVPCISSESHRFRQGFSQREGSRGARRGKEGTHRRAGVVRPSEVAVAGGRGGEWQVPL